MRLHGRPKNEHEAKVRAIAKGYARDVRDGETAEVAEDRARRDSNDSADWSQQDEGIALGKQIVRDARRQGHWDVLC